MNNFGIIYVYFHFICIARIFVHVIVGLPANIILYCFFSLVIILRKIFKSVVVLELFVNYYATIRNFYYFVNIYYFFINFMPNSKRF